jgi:RND family efflux transporter MFP subunit
MAVAGVVVGALVAGGILLALALKGPSASPSPTPVGAGAVRIEVAPVVSKDLVFRVTATGSIKPKESATVSSEVAARVLDVPIREGQAVTKGTPLARLNDRDLKLLIEEAQSAIRKDQVDLAKDQYDRHQRLFQTGSVTKLQLDQAKNQYLSLDSAYQAAQAKIRQLREQITKTTILSPISGVVARKFVNPGELLAPGAPVAVVENTQDVSVDVEVSDRDVVRLHQGMDVEATTDAYPGKVFKGVVDRVGSTANPVTRSFAVQARIDNSSQELRSGMIASLRVVLSKKRALVAPAEGITGEGEAAKALVVKDGVVRQVSVKIGDRLDREVEVVSGLAEGDEVVVYGGERLSDGQTVQAYRKP